MQRVKTKASILLGFAIIAMVLVVGCKGKKGSGTGRAHAKLIGEFKKFRAEQCLCTDYACSRKLGKRIGPRIVQIMRTSKSRPKAVNMKLGKILQEMTACANRTKGK